LRRWSSVLLRAFGFLLLVYLLYRADWQLLHVIWERLDVSYLYVLPLLTVMMIAVRAWRWNLLLRVHGAAFSPVRAWSVYATGVFLGTFTPGRLGDLAKAFYVRQERGLDWEKALAGALLDRLFDVAFMGLIAVWALFHLSVEIDTGLLLVAIALLAGVVFAFRLLGKRLSRWPFASVTRWSKAMDFVRSMRAELGQLTRAIGFWAAVLTIVAYGIYFTQTIYLARALDLPLSEGDIVAAIVLVGLASFLPLSVAGLGTREGILALVMARRAVPDGLEAALAYSALFFSFCFIVPGILGFVCWLARPFSMESLKQQARQKSFFAKDK